MLIFSIHKVQPQSANDRIHSENCLAFLFPFLVPIKFFNYRKEKRNDDGSPFEIFVPKFPENFDLTAVDTARLFNMLILEISQLEILQENELIRRLKILFFVYFQKIFNNYHLIVLFKIIYC